MLTRPFQEKKILIVDSDKTFAESFARRRSRADLTFVGASTRSEALAILAGSAVPFATVLVNKELRDKGTYSILRYVHLRHLGTPLYLLTDEESEVRDLEEKVQELGVRQILEKPITYEALMDEIDPFIKDFNVQKLIQDLPPDLSRAGTELGANDRDFTPIRAQYFVSGKKSFFSVYLRIRTGRYIKLLNAGDAFDFGRLAQYFQRGIQHFYIRREAHVAYLEYCDFIAKKLVDHGIHSIETQRNLLLNFAEETIHYFKDNGLSQDLIQHAVSFVETMNELTKKLQLDQRREIAAFMNNLVEWDHSVSVALVASLLMRGLRIETDRVQKSIGLAALLHDIGKSQACPSIAHEDISEMSEAEAIAYRDHAWAGATILSGVSGIDSTTIQAIAQHHERRDGKGFPLGLGAGKINRVAEIIGLADEFANLIVKNKNFPHLTKIQILQGSLLDGFSADVADSLCILFLRN